MIEMGEHNDDVSVDIGNKIGKINEDVSIDFEKVAESLRGEFDYLNPLSEHSCICRVPQKIRQLNESFYTPKIVSIGPLHHDRDEVKDVENDKLRYLQLFLERTRESNKGLVDFLKFMKGKEVYLRNCYAEHIKYNSEDFVKMILLDAVFLIVIFLRCVPNFQIKDRLFTHPGMIRDIVEDILLLENQVPIFILKDLFDFAQLQLPGRFEQYSLSQFAGSFFKVYVCPSILIDKNLIVSKFSDAKHFIDLLRLCLQPPTRDDNSSKRQDGSEAVPHIEKLYLCGVKFKLSSKRNLLDISFSGRNLEIPKLIISNLTLHLLRNLQIFESMYCDDNCINDYNILLNRLLSTRKDVELLVECGVIENQILDSEGVFKLFQELSRGARVQKKKFYYSGLVKNLQLHCNSKWHLWKAFFKRNYLTNPWVFASVVAASIMLILTFLQTFFTIKG